MLALLCVIHLNRFFVFCFVLAYASVASADQAIVSTIPQTMMFEWAGVFYKETQPPNVLAKL